jgi:hypothetical protein
MTLAPLPPKQVLMTADTVGGVWPEAGLIPYIRVFENNYKLERMNDRWDNVGPADEWLRKLEDEFRPEVVHRSAVSHSKGARCA